MQVTRPSTLLLSKLQESLAFSGRKGKAVNTAAAGTKGPGSPNTPPDAFHRSNAEGSKAVASASETSEADEKRLFVENAKKKAAADEEAKRIKNLNNALTNSYEKTLELLDADSTEEQEAFFREVESALNNAKKFHPEGTELYPFIVNTITLHDQILAEKEADKKKLSENKLTAEEVSSIKHLTKNLKHSTHLVQSIFFITTAQPIADTTVNSDSSILRRRAVSQFNAAMSSVYDSPSNHKTLFSFAKSLIYLNALVTKDKPQKAIIQDFLNIVTDKTAESLSKKRLVDLLNTFLNDSVSAVLRIKKDEAEQLFTPNRAIYNKVAEEYYKALSTVYRHPNETAKGHIKNALETLKDLVIPDTSVGFLTSKALEEKIKGASEITNETSKTELHAFIVSARKFMDENYNLEYGLPQSMQDIVDDVVENYKLAIEKQHANGNTVSARSLGISLEHAGIFIAPHSDESRVFDDMTTKAAAIQHDKEGESTQKEALHQLLVESGKKIAASFEKFGVDRHMRDSFLKLQPEPPDKFWLRKTPNRYNEAVRIFKTPVTTPPEKQEDPWKDSLPILTEILNTLEKNEKLHPTIIAGFRGHLNENKNSTSDEDYCELFRHFRGFVDDINIDNIELEDAPNVNEISRPSTRSRSGTASLVSSILKPGSTSSPSVSRPYTRAGIHVDNTEATEGVPALPQKKSFQERLRGLDPRRPKGKNRPSAE